MRTKEPLFIGVGAQRAGTSWLHNCLKNHPEVYMPRKEVHFFDQKYEKGEDWYTSLFQDCDGAKTVGEITPEYMVESRFVDRIKSYDEKVKLIVILRSPLERSVSAYNLYRSHGYLKDTDFTQALEKDKGILNKSLYCQQVAYILNRFDRDQVFICLFDDIEKQPEKLLKKVFIFLGVDDTYLPEDLHEKKNTSAMSGAQNLLSLPAIQKKLQNSILKGLFNRLKRSKIVRKIKRVLEDISRRSVSEIKFPLKYRSLVNQDIDKLSELIGRDLNHWKVN